MATGWIQINGQYFYLNPSTGQMYANTSLTLDGVTYTFAANGVCQNVGNIQASSPNSSGNNVSYGGPGSSGGNYNSNGPGGSSGNSNSPGSSNGSSGTSGSRPGSGNSNYNSDELPPFVTTGPKKDT